MANPPYIDAEQHVVLPERALNDRGQCCGRKPLVYKRPHRLFCCRCGAEYAPDGRQQENHGWKKVVDGFRSTYPRHGDRRHTYIEAALRAAAPGFLP